MKVIVPGHKYSIQNQDGSGEQTITFVRRIPESEAHEGTLCQELLRVLIDRVHYLDRQVPHVVNVKIRENLRECLVLFEQRAAQRKMEKMVEIEYQEVNPEDGHLLVPFIELDRVVQDQKAREQLLMEEREALLPEHEERHGEVVR